MKAPSEAIHLDDVTRLDSLQSHPGFRVRPPEAISLGGIMLHLHRAERADRLADALAEILAEPPADPFATEVVSVPTRGMERWLTQRLADRLGTSSGGDDGVCAGIDFPFPGRLIGEALAIASGIDPDADPWTAERMVWPLVHTIEECLEEPWLAPLASHLSQGRERRYAHVREIAALFDGYGFRRPELVLAWCAGEAGAGGWQPELWRRLREAIGVPSGAERLGPACSRLRAEPDLLALPSRLGLFGITRLPPSYLEVLHALAAGREVHLFLLHPSPALWQAVAEELPAPERGIRRADDPSAGLPRNRLLASWGRDVRELQLVLAAGGPALHEHRPLAAETRDTVLAALQADIRIDRSAPGPPLPGREDERRPLQAGDDSLRIHACHGRQRQVEVLREAILHRLAADPTLEPRDVIVMCPDIETFAPLIQATFGSGHPVTDDEDSGAAGAGRIDLRVRLADRSLRQTNPVLGVVARMLELARARLTASEVLDLADTDPVRRRFRLDDDDLARLQDWIVEGGIHWGLDGAHRAAFKLERVEAGTWRSGLGRLLLGASLGESPGRLYAEVLPIDDVESGSLELAGRFAELVDRLAVALDRLAGPHTVTGWSAALAAAADALLDTPEREVWQRQELDRMLDDLVAEAEQAGQPVELTLPEIRALIGHRLAGRPTRANFRTGHLTVCTLHPMRSVPHRVVALLGLDDGAFPRRAARNGDDLLLEDPRLGDRDPRSEDRQLLLDALMAAEEALVITYSGNDERTNAPRPPAVPVGELLDAVDATVRCPDDPNLPARRRVLVHHPLQPFDPVNFIPGRLRADGPWSFDAVSLEGAHALEGERRPAAPFLAAPLPPVVEVSLALTDLIAFAQRPVRAFLRQRLGISAGAWDDELSDALPVELDHLERWQVGDRLLAAALAGADPETCRQAERARGTLPPGLIGEPVLDAVWDEVSAILGHARTHWGGEDPVSFETNLMLAGGTRLTGTVSGVRGTVLTDVSFSRLSARHRLTAWVRLLALSAAHPGVPFSALTLGRARASSEGEVTLAQIPPLARGAEERRRVALAELASLAALRACGLREPLPLPCLTAAAYAAALHARADAEQARKMADRVWTSGYRFDHEDRERDHLLAFGRELPLDDLLSIPPREAEAGEGWATEESSRFGRLARRLWAPLLAREAVSDL
jgi:exodeoxyribonuclease V gamma subunit